MHLSKLLAAFALMGATQAFYISTFRSREQCFRDKLEQAVPLAPADADAVICYHGNNSVFDKTKNWGYIHYVKCSDIGIDCLWIKKGNSWQGEEDGGSKNLAYLIRSPNECEFHHDWRAVDCAKNS